jgi:DNA-binding NarL/FixJ family response regulator
MEKIKVAVVDDMADIREYIAAALEKEADIRLVGQSDSGAGAVELVRKLKPDVVLMDILMESPDAGLLAAEIINKEFPQIRLIILTIHEDDHLMFRAYCAGAMDYILKTVPVAEVAQAIRNVFDNRMMIRPNVATKIISEFTRLRVRQESLLFVYNVISKLTNSEFDILTLVYEGYKYRQIADMRFVSQVTIKSQVNRILHKFQRKSMKEILFLLEKMNFRDIIKEIKSSADRNQWI